MGSTDLSFSNDICVAYLYIVFYLQTEGKGAAFPLICNYRAESPYAPLIYPLIDNKLH